MWYTLNDSSFLPSARNNKPFSVLACISNLWHSDIDPKSNCNNKKYLHYVLHRVIAYLLLAILEPVHLSAEPIQE